MPINYYLLAIETLGMRSRKASVINRFNRVATYSDDKRLQDLAAKVIRELYHTSSSPEIIATLEMKSVPSARELMRYCQRMARPIQIPPP